MRRKNHRLAAVLAVVLIAGLGTGCSGADSKYSSDPVLQKNAKEACEYADGMPNLGSNFHWTHSISGDFDPSFTDTGSFDWGYLNSTVAQKHYEFACKGRFDDDHMEADAVLESLTST